MSMERRIKFALDQKQIEEACEAFIAPRLQADETAHAKLLSVATSTKHDGSVEVTCMVSVSKKRVRKKKSGAPT